MIIDCDSCEVRGHACGECVIGVLWGAPTAPGRPAGGVTGIVEGPAGPCLVHLDPPERRALDVLADQGLIRRLRLAPPAPTSPGGAIRDVG